MSNRSRRRSQQRGIQPRSTVVNEIPMCGTTSFPVPRWLREAYAPTTERQSERTTVTEATTGGATVAAPGRLRIRLIRAGWSLNGNHYGADVLRRAAENGAFPRGTLCFADHATESEDEARPTGSIRDLAGVLTGDARWDEQEQALIAEARLFAPWREAITDMADTIGMSIRAWVYGDHGEIDSQSGFVVSEIAEGRSVDFVTVPAAGGAILSVLESVGNRPVAEARNVGAWLEPRLHLALTQLGDDMYGQGRLTRRERITLSSAIGDALTAWTARVEADAPQLFERDLWDEPERDEPDAAEEARRQVGEAPTEDTRMALTHAVRAAHVTDDDTWAYVRDFDPDRRVVWFEVGDKSGTTCRQQGYQQGGDGAAELVGEPIEVVARIVYQPVSRGDASEAPTQPAPTAATAVTEDVTDGAPPTAPNPTIREEHPMSGSTETGQGSGVQAGTVESAAQAPAALTEARVAELVQAAVAQATEPFTGRLAEAETRLAAERERNDTREAELRRLRNENIARDAVTTALRATQHGDVAVQIGPRVTSRALAAVPTADDGSVDTVRLSETITSAIADEAAYVRSIQARTLEESGFGSVHGLGVSTPTEANDGFDDEMNDFFGSTLGLSSEAAKIAAKGRN